MSKKTNVVARLDWQIKADRHWKTKNISKNRIREIKKAFKKQSNEERTKKCKYGVIMIKAWSKKQITQTTNKMYVHHINYTHSSKQKGDKTKKLGKYLIWSLMATSHESEYTWRAREACGRAGTRRSSFFTSSKGSKTVSRMAGWLTSVVAILMRLRAFRFRRGGAPPPERLRRGARDWGRGFAVTSSIVGDLENLFGRWKGLIW